MTDESQPPPPLFGEPYILAQVLDIVSRYCRVVGDELDSYGVAAYADLMRLCAEVGDIEITGGAGERITGRITLEGSHSLRAFDAEREGENPQPPSRLPVPDYAGFSDGDLKAAWNKAHDQLGAIIEERTNAHDLDMRHIQVAREIAYISDALHRRAPRMDKTIRRGKRDAAGNEIDD